MRIVSLLVLAAVATACGGNGGGTEPPPEIATVSVSPATTSTMKSIGDAVSLTATVRDADNDVINNATVTWTSSSNSVIALNPTTGLTVNATAAGNGTATVTAKAGTKTSTPVSFTVQQELASVGFSPSNLSVQVNETKALAVNGRDARGNTIGTGITLSSFLSRDESRVTVAQGTGTSISVTGVAAGTARIVATVAQGTTTRTDSTTVTVTVAPPAEVNVTATAGNIFNPSNVTTDPNGTVNWTFEALHNVTFISSAPPGGNIPDRSSGTVSRTFTTSGSYPYYCTIHGGVTGTSCTGMCGSVTVR